MAKKWIWLVVGIWVMISPWLLGFAEITLAKWSNILCGLVMVIMSTWALAEKPKKV